MGKAWVGVDGGKRHHWAVVVDEGGRVLLSRKVTNTQEAIGALISDVAALADELVWAVDLTDSSTTLLRAVLWSTSAQLVYVPGRMVNRAADAYRGEAKTDAKDARIIADQARMRRDFAALRPSGDVLAELAMLITHRRDVAADRGRLITRLRSHLTAIFPGLERIVDLTNRGGQELIARWQTPRAIRKAGQDYIAAYLIGHGSRKADKLASAAMQAAREQTITLPGEDVTAGVVAQLARQLLELEQRLKKIDADLADRVASHPYGQILTSLPGIGPVLAAEFIVSVADLANFANADHLAAYAGLAPVPHDSGRISGNLRRPQRFSRMLRRVFYASAVVAAQLPGPSRDYYQRKRAEGKRPVQAYMALARRRVNVLWAMLRDDRPYTPAPPAKVPVAA